MPAKYAVIGLGNFGMILAKALGKSGAEIIAVDINKDEVEEAREFVSVAVKMDSTDEKALVAQGVNSVDVAIVCIGRSFENTILTTVVLKSLGVKKVVVRAANDTEKRILEKIGADEVINPEEASAKRLAQRILLPNIIDLFELAQGHSMIQINAPKQFHNIKVRQTDLRKKYELNLVAIKKRIPKKDKDGNDYFEDRINDVPSPDDIIQPDDILVIVGSDENINRLPKAE